MIRQMLRFGIVGLGATLVHMTIGLILIQVGWSPLLANFLAFLFAFFVSFAGHLGFSFADQRAEITTALSRFAVVAIAGLVVSEGLLAISLKLELITISDAFVIAVFSAAILTFLLSRYWAFRHHHATHPTTQT